MALLALPGPLTAHIRPLTASSTWMLFSPCPQLTPYNIGSQKLLQHKHLHYLASANNFRTVLDSERKERRNVVILGRLLFLVHVSSSSSFFKYTKRRTFLVLQGLRLQAPNAGAQGPFLVRELDPTCHNKHPHASKKLKDPLCYN